MSSYQHVLWNPFAGTFLAHEVAEVSSPVDRL